MKTRHPWKPIDRLDGIMNVLLITLALCVLGVNAFEFDVDVAIAAAEVQHEV